MNERYYYEFKVFFAWYDIWIGMYIDKKKETLYICLLPCVVIRIKRVDIYSEKYQKQRGGKK